MSLTRIKIWLAAAGAAVVALVSMYLRGRLDEVEIARRRELQRYKETRERIDEAEVHGDDPAAARRWLQHYADQERGRGL